MAHERRNEGHKSRKSRPRVEGGGEELRVISIWSVREEKTEREAVKQRKGNTTMKHNQRWGIQFVVAVENGETNKKDIVEDNRFP